MKYITLISFLNDSQFARKNIIVWTKINIKFFYSCTIKISLLISTHDAFDIADPKAVCNMNLHVVYAQACHKSVIAQWLEHLTRVWKVIRFKSS